MNLFFCTLILFTSALFIGGCKKEKTVTSSPSAPWSLVPVIAYSGYEKYADSLILNFSFEDNDGDISLDNSDTSGFLKPGNLWIVYYYKDSVGNWNTLDMPSPGLDSVIFKFRIPACAPVFAPVTIHPAGYPMTLFLTPSSHPGKIQGNMRVKISAPYAVHPEVRYATYLYDRARNKSNTVTTGSIYP